MKAKYAPAVPGPWPVAVFFHGDSVPKTYLAGLSHKVAERGVVVFTPTWRSRLPFESEVKKGLRMDGYEDAACAIRFAREKAAGFGGDPTRVTAVGHSAGGGASAMMALAGDNFHGDCLVNEGSALVDGMVGLEGAYNLNQFVPENLYQLATPEGWAVFNPFIYIDQQPIRKEVTFQIVMGNTEEFIVEGKGFYEALKAAGYSPAFTEFPDVDHYNVASPDESILRIILEAVQPAAN